MLAGLGVVGGIAQSVSSVKSFNQMRSSLSSKPSLSSGAGQQYADIADGVCFTAGTEVKTEEGRKAIEEIEAGDRVYARNTETGEEGYKEVVRVFRKETKELLHIQIGESRIDTTPNHPFWVEGCGFREAGELKEGDRVLSADGEVLEVSHVETEILEEPVRVYNFEVADWHTYYVSGEEVLVHNTCMVGQSARKSGKTTRRREFRQAKEAAGIPKSAQYNTHKFVYDSSSENRIVYEFNVNGEKKYIIEHPFDKMGRGNHFHGADASKGSPFNKGRYNQYDGHFPEDFDGFD